MVANLKLIGLGSVLGMALWFSIGALAFAQPTEQVTTKKTVIAIRTIDCATSYSDQEAANFRHAMSETWPEFYVLTGCAEPDHPLTSRMDYENWQHELGLGDYQTLFVTKSTSDLFSTSEYDGYTYPANKIGFMKVQQATNTFLLSHELLHLGLYDLSAGDFSCWSVAVHEHYYGGKHPQNVSVNAGNGWTKTYGILEHFNC